jgi:hypothetical protein
LSHGDPMWIDYDELYKKDGSYIGREKKRHWARLESISAKSAWSVTSFG